MDGKNKNDSVKRRTTKQNHQQQKQHYHHNDNLLITMANQELSSAEVKAKENRQFRRIWIPIIRNAVSSIADIAGDWFFYSKVRTYDAVAPSVVHAILVFSIISSVIGLFSVVAFFMHRSKSCTSIHNVHKDRFEAFVKILLASEIIIEDIPQFILTFVVLNSRFGLSPEAVFNITTSSFNFIFSLLDILSPLDEEEDEDEEGADNFDEEGV
jgi:hypothetical protein